MTWVVETGSGVTGANTYYSIASITSWCNNRGLTAWASASTTSRDAALCNAMDYIESLSYKGYKVSYSYPLRWPRYDCYDTDGYYTNVVLIPSGLPYIPDAVKNAVARAAYEEVVSPNCLTPALTKQNFVKREKIDVLEFEYSKEVPGTIYQKVVNYLKPYLKSKNFVDVERT